MGSRAEDPDGGPAGPDTGWVAGLLDAEAGRYSPDGRRIRAAVHQRVRGGPYRELARVRPSRATAGIVTAVLAAAAAVAVVATVETRQAPAGLSPAAASGGLPLASRTPAAGPPGQADGGATQSTARDRPIPASATATAAPAATPAATATATPAPASSSPSAPGATGSSAPSTGARAGLVSAAGTSDLGTFPYWIQEEVSVSLRAPVTALRLTVTVARTAEVASTGYWTTDDPADFDVSVAARAGTLTYTFTLKPGRTLPAGSSAFAVQFNHGTNSHDPAADTYALSVTGNKQNGGVPGAAAGAF